MKFQAADQNQQLGLKNDQQEENPNGNQNKQVQKQVKFGVRQ